MKKPAGQVARRAADAEAILEKLIRLRILTWRYKHEPAHVRHLGPIAEEFAEAFEVGGSNRVIAFDDALGVAYASIQALSARMAARKRELEKLRRQVARLAARHAP
jgi:hypothetical protein